MSQAWSARRQILFSPWRQHLDLSGAWTLALAAAIVILPASALALSGSPGTARAVLLASAAAVLQILGVMQIMGILRQNHPHAAHLVPAHARRLRECAVGAYLGLLFASGCLMDTLTGHGLAWVLGDAVVLLYMVTIPRWPMLGLLPGVVLLPLAVWSPGRAATLRAVPAFLLDAYAREPLFLALVVLGASAFLLTRLVQVGKLVHRRAYLNGETRPAWLRTVYPDAAPSGGPFGAPGLDRRLALATYGWCLRRLLSKARPFDGGVLARAEMSVGASFHWSGLLAHLLLGITPIVVILALVVGGAPPGAAALGKLDVALGAVTSALMSWLLLVNLGLPSAFHVHRREQALLMLVPGMPQGAALNRGLAFRMVRQYLFAWTLGWFLLAGMARVMPIPAWSFGVALSYLPLAACLARDLARQTAQTWDRRILLAVLATLAGAGGLAALIDLGGVPPWALLPAVVAVTAIALWWRWRRLASYPQAWPTGRLAR